MGRDLSRIKGLKMKWRKAVEPPPCTVQAAEREKAPNPKQCFITQGNAKKPSAVGLPYLCRKALDTSLSSNLLWKPFMDCKGRIRTASASCCSLLFSGHQHSCSVRLWQLEQMRSRLARQDTYWRVDPTNLSPGLTVVTWARSDLHRFIPDRHNAKALFWGLQCFAGLSFSMQ